MSQGYAIVDVDDEVSVSNLKTPTVLTSRPQLERDNPSSRGLEFKSNSACHLFVRSPLLISYNQHS